MTSRKIMANFYSILSNLFVGIMAPTYDVKKTHVYCPKVSVIEFISNANRVMEVEGEAFIWAFDARDWIAAGHAIERAQVKIVNLAIKYDVDLDKYSTPDGISLT